MSVVSKNHLAPEDLRFNPPCFSLEALRQVAETYFGITGDLKSLKGERDQNARLTAQSGQHYVLKISGKDEAAEIVDFQVQALLHLERAAPNLAVMTKNHPSADGEGVIDINPVAWLYVERLLPKLHIGSHTDNPWCRQEGINGIIAGLATRCAPVIAVMNIVGELAPTGCVVIQ